MCIRDREELAVGAQLPLVRPEGGGRGQQLVADLEGRHQHPVERERAEDEEPDAQGPRGRRRYGPPSSVTHRSRPPPAGTRRSRWSPPSEAARASRWTAPPPCRPGST